jgi:hypothetical protein
MSINSIPGYDIKAYSNLWREKKRRRFTVITELVLFVIELFLLIYFVSYIRMLVPILESVGLGLSQLFSGIFLMVLLLALFGAIRASIYAIHQNPKVQYLLSAPISTKLVFSYELSKESFHIAGLAILYTLPFIAVLTLSALSCLLAVVVIAAIFLIATAIGNMIGLLLIRITTVRRITEVGVAIFFVLYAVLYGLWILRPELFVSGGQSFLRSKLMILMIWGSEAIFEYQVGYLLLVVALSVLLLVSSAILTDHSYYSGWATRVKVEKKAMRAAWRSGRFVTPLIRKDFILFRRRPSLLGMVFMYFIFGVVLSLSFYGMDDAFPALLITYLFAFFMPMVTTTTPLAYEGKALWFLHSSPAYPEQFMKEKIRLAMLFAGSMLLLVGLLSLGIGILDPFYFLLYVMMGLSGSYAISTTSCSWVKHVNFENPRRSLKSIFPTIQTFGLVVLCYLILPPYILFQGSLRLLCIGGVALAIISVNIAIGKIMRGRSLKCLRELESVTYQ